MTTQSLPTTVNQANVRTTLLHRVLLTNATVTGLTGLLLVLDAGIISPHLGGVAPWLLMVFGVVLLISAAVIYTIGRQPVPNRPLVQAIFAVDVIWVVASIFIVVSGGVALTTAGQWGIIVLADLVALFAIGEWWGLRKLGRNG